MMCIRCQLYHKVLTSDSFLCSDCDEKVSVEFKAIISDLLLLKFDEFEYLYKKMYYLFNQVNNNITYNNINYYNLSSGFNLVDNYYQKNKKLQIYSNPTKNEWNKHISKTSETNSFREHSLLLNLVRERNWLSKELENKNKIIEENKLKYETDLRNCKEGYEKRIKENTLFLKLNFDSNKKEIIEQYENQIQELQLEISKTRKQLAIEIEKVMALI